MGLFGKKKPPPAAVDTPATPKSPVKSPVKSPAKTPRTPKAPAKESASSSASSSSSSSDSDAEDAPPPYEGVPCTMRLAIGVDGGGTGTTCVVIGDGDDEPLGTCELSERSSNANSVGFEAALATVLDAVRGALDDALDGTQWNKEDVTLGVNDAVVGKRALAVTCAGIDGSRDVARWRTALVAKLPGLARNLVVDNDAAGALASGTGGAMRGIALVAGTGTVAFGVAPGEGAEGADTAVRGEEGADGAKDFPERKERRARAGGWGPAFEDRGSGHHLGTRALNAAARVCDGRGPPTRLHADVLKKLRLRPDEHAGDGLRRWAYQSKEWSKVADLAPLVTKAAADGDGVAVGIVNEAAEGLWEQIFAVYMAVKRAGGFGAAKDAGDVTTKSADGDVIPIVLVGGLLKRDGVLTKKLGESLMARASGRCGMFSGLLIHPSKRPEWGAAWIARRLMDPYGR